MVDLVVAEMLGVAVAMMKAPVTFSLEKKRM